MNQSNEKRVNFRIALIGVLAVIVILFFTGLFINRPEPVRIQGEAEAAEVRISGKVSGRIQEIFVEEGQFVKAGDTLALIDSPELSAKLDQATAARNAAVAQNSKAIKGARQEQINSAYQMWQKAVVGVDIAEKSYKRVQSLYEKGVATAQKHDEAKAQYDAAVATEQAAKSQYDMAVAGAEIEDKLAARAMVDRASGAIQEVESYIRETALISPIDGMVTAIYPKRGELVGSGSPVMSIVDLDDVWFTFNVREDHLSGIKNGAVMSVKIPALDNREVEVKVTYVKALASYATWKATTATGGFDAKTFEVKAKPAGKIDDLLPGMSAVVMNDTK